jgi:hypothetical protein
MIIPRYSAQLDAVTTNKVPHHIFAVIEGITKDILPTSPLTDAKLPFPMDQIDFHPNTITNPNSNATSSITTSPSSSPEYLTTRNHTSPPEYYPREDSTPSRGRNTFGKRQGSYGFGSGERMNSISIPILEYSIYERRVIGIVHNQSPTLGVNELDDRFQTFVEGLGLVEGRCGSNVVS